MFSVFILRDYKGKQPIRMCDQHRAVSYIGRALYNISGGNRLRVLPA